MTYVIGTDEAGYGPNLGPLIISATVWWVDDPAKAGDLYRVLRRCVCNDLSQVNSRRVALADSKILYKAGGGLHDLELGILASLAAAGMSPQTWRELWHCLDAHAARELDALAWHVGYDLALPLEVDQKRLEKVSRCFLQGLETSGVRLVGVTSRAVFPRQFNELTDRYQNKGEALSRLTLELLGDALKLLPDEPVIVYCDKHGGRNRYSELLQRQFPDWLVEICGEAGDESIYRFGPENRRVEVGFRVRSERFLPTALASMASKYLREVSMRAFNSFWCTRVPGLLPTAGYPVDARRFKTEIEPLQMSLGIEDRLIWRNR